MCNNKSYLLRVFSLVLVLGGLSPLVGCEKGPAERAGESVDNAARKVRDTVNPPSGPAEAAGARSMTQQAGLHDGCRDRQKSPERPEPGRPPTRTPSRLTMPSEPVLRSGVKS